MSTMLTFDPTGLNPANRASNELHSVDLAGARIIQPRHGSMYWKSVTLTISSTGRVLRPGDGLQAFKYDPEVSAIAGGQEVVYGIVITDNTAAGDMLLNGQYVGGFEGRGRAAIEELLELIRAASTGPIDWSRVRAPATFRPDPDHKHDLTSIRELEKLTMFARDMAEGFKNNARMGKTGNVLNSRIDRMLGVLVGMQDSLNKISTKGFDAVTEAELGEVSETVDAVIELLLQTNSEMGTMNARLSTLEEAMQDFFQAFSLNMGNMTDTIDVVPGSDYLTAGSALATAILLSIDTEVSASLLTVRGVPETGTVNLLPNRIQIPATSGTDADKIFASCIRASTPFYFEVGVRPITDADNVVMYKSAEAKLGFGMPVESFINSVPAINNGAEAVFETAYQINQVTIRKDVTASEVYMATENLPVSPAALRVGVSYNPANREVSLRVVAGGSGINNTLPGGDPVLITMANAATNPNDLNILARVFSNLEIEQNVTFYTEAGQFLIGSVPVGFTPLNEVTFAIVPYNLSTSVTP